MQVLVPNPIDDSMIVSSTAAEPGPGEVLWNADTDYALNATVYIGHRKYRASVANKGRNPATDTAFPAAWADIGPTNFWSMFDEEVSTQTVAVNELTVIITPGGFGALAMFGLDGVTAEISMKDRLGGDVVYQRTVDLDVSDPPDYWEYFFSPFKMQTDLILSDIPAYSSAELTIKITGGGKVKAGYIAIGDMRTLGKTVYGAKAKLVDYSYIKIDEFGNNKIIKRKNAKDMSAEVWLKVDEANQVIDTLAELLAVPCVWIASDEGRYSGLRVFGLGTGEVSFDHPQDCLLTLNVQGLI